jgi:hypothetical protein
MGVLYGTSVDTTSPLLRSLVDDGAILRQWVALQLATATGIYWSAPEVGADVCQIVNKGLTTQQVAAIPGQVQAALEYDQRISRVDVQASATFTAIGETAIKLTVTIYPKSPALAPFSLTAIASSDVINTITRGS